MLEIEDSFALIPRLWQLFRHELNVLPIYSTSCFIVVLNEVLGDVKGVMARKLAYVIIQNRVLMQPDDTALGR